NVGLREHFHANGRLQPRLHVQAFERLLQGNAVEDRGEHAHIVGRGFLDDAAAGGELRAAQDIARANDDAQLHAAVVNALDLGGDIERLVDADTAFAPR